MWESMFHLVHATSLGISEYRWSPKTCGHRRRKRVGGWWLVAPRALWCGTQLASPGQKAKKSLCRSHFWSISLLRSLLSASPSARRSQLPFWEFSSSATSATWTCFVWGQRQCEAWSWTGRRAWKLWLHSVLDVGLLPGRNRKRFSMNTCHFKKSRDAQLMKQDIVHRCIPRICQGCDQEYNFKLNVKAAPWETEAEEADVEVPVAGGVPVVFTIFQSKNIEKNERTRNATKQ